MQRKIKIIASGVAVPSKKVTHTQFDHQFNVTDSFKISGILERYMSVDETASQLGAQAATQAINNSPLVWPDIDCLIVASATMDKALPYNAAMLHAQLGLDNQRTTTLDIGASCMSFLMALDMASYLIECNRFKNIMIVSSDIPSYTLDFKNIRENGIFGDGAAAFIISKTPENETSTIMVSQSSTLSKGVDFCQINAGGSRYHNRDSADYKETFSMKGKNVFALVMREFPAFFNGLLEQAQLKKEDIDFFVPHQASMAGLTHMFKELKIAEDKWINIFPYFGNQVAASLPSALHYAIKQEKIKRNDIVYLLGSGAGITLGGLILRY